MVQGDDGRGLSQSVALNDDEAELAPECFERRVEWRRADDEGPELQSEGAVNSAIPPPSAGEMFAPILLGDAFSAAIRSLHVLFQHVEHLRHRDEHRDPAL